MVGKIEVEQRRIRAGNKQVGEIEPCLDKKHILYTSMQDVNLLHLRVPMDIRDERKCVCV